MNQTNRKFFYRDIVIILIGIIVGIVMINIIDNAFHKQATGENGSIYMDLITTKAISTLTLCLIIANILLVLKTKDYADQTTKMAIEAERLSAETANMAQGTNKMVDYYYHSQKLSVMPFFIPPNDFLKMFTVGEVIFKFLNAGQDALFVQIFVKDKAISDIYTRILGSNFIESKMYEYIKENYDVTDFIVSLIYYDKMMNKYKQNLRFDMKQLAFEINPDIMPTEISDD